VLKTLKSRVLLVLVASLALSHLVGLWLYARKHEEAASLLQDALLADRIALTARLLEGAKPEERERLVARLDSPLVKISTRQAAVSPAPKIEGTRPHLFEHLVGLFLDRPGHEGIGTAFAPAVGPSTGQSLRAMLSATLDPEPHHLPAGTLDEIRTPGTVTTGITLDDGAVITFTAPLLTVSPFSALKLWAPLLAILLSVIVSGAWVLNRATEPLMTLARAAERLGADIHADPLPERGASEVRSASRAFNAMQERIKRLLEDRTAFSAAMAHDIGTPVTRLLLRLEELPESEVKPRMASDIAQMQRMIKATLGFARAEFQAEPSERFDVVALVQSIADDLTDMGAPVTSSGLAHLPVVSKPIALRRGFELDLSSGHDARTSDRTGPQPAERNDQVTRDVRIETRHQIVNAPDRAFDLSLNGVETRAGVGGAGKSLKRDRGLMFRQSLPDDGGMLFDYDPPQAISFWMKNTLIPLDMVFINADGTIRSIRENTVPNSLATVDSRGPVRAVSSPPAPICAVGRSRAGASSSAS